MLDQAFELRQLMRFAARDGRRQRQLRLIAVAGARSGVGATTVALNLAVELSRHGQRTVLVDADLEGGAIAARCGIDEGIDRALSGVADVLTGRRDLREVLREGPFGLSIATGVCRVEHTDAWNEAAQDRLIRALRELEDVADVVVLDAGRGVSPAGHHFCEAADEVLVVTTTKDDALLDAYATLKATHQQGHRPKVRVLFNRVGSDADAHSARERLTQTCRRFLGKALPCAGCCAEDHRVAESSRAGIPLAIQSPRSPLVRDLERLAAALRAERSEPAIRADQAALVHDRAALATA
jgi:flagellar biosynthesis protein FlhG